MKHKLSVFNLKRSKKVTQTHLKGMDKRFGPIVVANLHSFWGNKE